MALTAELTPIRPAEPQSRAEASDSDLAADVMQAMHRFQDALDRAVMAGLIVEPAFKKVENRFAKIGVSGDSCLVNVQIYRKLS